MIVLLLLAALVPPALAAWTVLERVLSLRGRGPAALALSVALATILGTGAATLGSYAWLVAGGTLGPVYAALETTAFLAIAALSWRRIPARPVESPPPSRADLVALTVVVLAAVVLAAALVARAEVMPHGEWDAWAIWNQRARFLFRAGAQWRLAFESAAHSEYPLLVPLAVARLWSFAGETVLAPLVLASMFTVGTILVVYGAVALRSGPVAGAAASLLLLGTEAWMHRGSSQYADVPLASFLACATALLLTTRTDSGQRWGAVALAGACLGLCAWTKNEGVVFAALFGAWAIASGAGAGRPWRARAAALAAGAALPVLARLHFQMTLVAVFAPEFTANQAAGSMVSRMVEASRWRKILLAAVKHLPGRSLPLPLIAAGVAWLLGARVGEARRSPSIVPALAGWTAFLFVYASTPKPLDWHLATSMERVLLQPWPALLIGIMALVPALERATAPQTEAVEPEPGVGLPTP